jgi:hypothetical protein
MGIFLAFQARHQFVATGSSPDDVDVRHRGADVLHAPEKEWVVVSYYHSTSHDCSIIEKAL